MSYQPIGGPCRKCGLVQAERAKKCERSKAECPYGKFGQEHTPKRDAGLAAALGVVSGTLAYWEIAFGELEARVSALEKRNG